MKKQKNTNTKGGAIRYSSKKLPWRLLPWDAMTEVVKVYAWGCLKYDARNWEKGLSFDETYDSMMRHAKAWYLGEERNKDDGNVYHLAQVVWNALALLAFTLRGQKELDDRPAYCKRKRRGR